jgi:signal transduction histidine kinase
VTDGLNQKGGNSQSSTPVVSCAIANQASRYGAQCAEMTRQPDRVMESIAQVSIGDRDRANINEAIHEVIALTQTEVERNGIRWQTQLADDLPLVPADRVQLQQVIMNLIVNAIEAMAGVGDRPRELTVAFGEGDANTVFVKVQDTDPGIDPTDLNPLFQSFYTTKPDGIGMGLAISRSIVEARLSAAPNQPHGAVFQFTVSAGGRRFMSTLFAVLERQELCEARHRHATLAKLGNPFPDTARAIQRRGANVLITSP